MEKRYGLPTAISMVIGIVIGSGVFIKGGKVLALTHGNMLQGVLVVALVGAICIICSLVFAELGAKYEKVNGVVDYAEVALGPSYSYYVGWFMTTIYYPCLSAMLAFFSAVFFLELCGIQSLDFFVTGTVRSEALGLGAGFLMIGYGINAISPKLAGKLQVSMTIIKLVPLLLMAVVGIIVGAVVLIIALGAAARGGKISFMQNVSGIVKAPMQKVLSSAVNWFDSLYGYLYDYDSLMAENESLRSQLADAQKSARDGIAASEENTRLRKLLELREKHTDYEMESAKVVLWSSSNWSSSFTISKGETSGIEIGDPVITEYGAVVGQITELGTNWATVSTLIDVDMSVGAFVGAAGNSGMVVGEYSFMKNKTAKLTFLADGAQIFVGDDVLTSGSGGAFPSGLVIGTLTAVQTEAGGQIEYGIVEPQCNLDSLVQVFIIKSFEVVE